MAKREGQAIVSVVMKEEMKKEIEKLAKNNLRSLSAQIVYMLKAQLEEEER